MTHQGKLLFAEALMCLLLVLLYVSIVHTRREVRALQEDMQVLQELVVPRFTYNIGATNLLFTNNSVTLLP